jgi:hypothetical protein
MLPNGRIGDAFGGYGDRNEYTVAVEKWIQESGFDDFLLAVFEGKSDTVALFTVDRWDRLGAKKKRELVKTLFSLWLSIRDPIMRDPSMRAPTERTLTLEEGLRLTLSLDVIIVDINGTKLADFAWSKRPPNLKEVHRKEGRVPAAWVISQFKKMTQLQRERWNGQNEWAFTVYGEGIVEEVRTPSASSKIQGNYIELIIAVGDDGVIISCPANDQYKWVYDIARGSEIPFEGKLKEVQDLGLWTVAYIKAE